MDIFEILGTRNKKKICIELLKHTNTKANQEMLNKINNNGLTQDEIDAELKKTIRVQINTLYMTIMTILYLEQKIIIGKT